MYMASDHLDLLLQWVQVKKRFLTFPSATNLFLSSYVLKGDRVASRATDSMDDSTLL